MTNPLITSHDVVFFGSGVTTADVEIIRPASSDDLLITLTSTGDTLLIRDQFKFSVFGPDGFFSVHDAIEEFRFDDGTVWTDDTVMDMLLEGTSGDDLLRGFFRQDTLDGGAGNDRLEGDADGDTYIYVLGYGHDTIYDLRWGLNQTTTDKVMMCSTRATGLIR